MSFLAIAYVASGALLVILLGAITAHYYSRERRAKVEEAKYKMLDDDG